MKQIPIHEAKQNDAPFRIYRIGGETDPSTVCLFTNVDVAFSKGTPVSMAAMVEAVNQLAEPSRKLGFHYAVQHQGILERVELAIREMVKGTLEAVSVTSLSPFAQLLPAAPGHIYEYDADDIRIFLHELKHSITGAPRLGIPKEWPAHEPESKESGIWAPADLKTIGSFSTDDLAISIGDVPRFEIPTCAIEDATYVVTVNTAYYPSVHYLKNKEDAIATIDFLKANVPPSVDAFTKAEEITVSRIMCKATLYNGDNAC